MEHPELNALSISNLTLLMEGLNECNKKHQLPCKYTRVHHPQKWFWVGSRPSISILVSQLQPPRGNQRATKASACTCKWPQRVPHHIQKEGEKENESMTICKYHTHSHTLTHTYICLSICVYIYRYIYLRVYIFTHIYIYIYIVFIYLFVYLFISKRT